MFTALLPAQSIEVYSEFQRIDPFGKVVGVDKSESPREILSPAIARNSFASFQIAVTIAEKTPFTLHVGQNPEGALKVNVYKAEFSRNGTGWVPDKLVPVSLPYAGLLPESGSPVEGQTTLVFWLDIWVPFDFPARRMKVEPQLLIHNRWVVYPMEVRVIHTVIPKFEPGAGRLPPVDAPADAPAQVPLRSFLCGTPEVDGETEELNIRRMIRRNAEQDAALARRRGGSVEKAKEELLEVIPRITGTETGEGFCKSADIRSRWGAEWYLRMRDFLYQN